MSSSSSGLKSSILSRILIFLFQLIEICWIGYVNILSSWSSRWSLTPKPSSAVRGQRSSRWRLLAAFSEIDDVQKHDKMKLLILKLNPEQRPKVQRKASQIFYHQSNYFYRGRFSSTIDDDVDKAVVYFRLLSLRFVFLPDRAYCLWFGVVLCALNTN